jgi:phosphate transport system substrate-binding protein
LVTLAFAATLFGAAAGAAEIRLIETGSTLLYPLFNLWVGDYRKTHPGIDIVTQGIGSGAGITEAISGAAHIGASDAYMSDFQLRAAAGILNIPLAISSQMVNYNIPGLDKVHLNLSGPVLAGIYQGKIRFWDDTAIGQLNRGVRLPHNQIVPIHRTDGSGDTFIFTQYLSFSTPEWSDSQSYGTTLNWPAVRTAIGVEGNSGMVEAARQTPYAIAYVGISFKNAVEEAGLGTAKLLNKDGKFLLPDPATVTAAVKETAPKTPPHERISLIFPPGAQSYPIINYEYAIVKTEQASAGVAAALKAFLNWAVDPNGGNAAHYMNAVGFVALPEAIVKLSQKQIAQIH